MLMHPKEISLLRDSAEETFTSICNRMTETRYADDMGGAEIELEEGPDTICRIGPLSAQERLRADAISVKRRSRLFVPHDFEIEVHDCIQVDGTLYCVETIETPRSPDEIVRSVIIYLEDN